MKTTNGKKTHLFFYSDEWRARESVVWQWTDETRRWYLEGICVVFFLSISENRISFSRSFSFLLRLWPGHGSNARVRFFTPLIRSIWKHKFIFSAKVRCALDPIYSSIWSIMFEKKKKSRPTQQWMGGWVVCVRFFPTPQTDGMPLVLSIPWNVTDSTNRTSLTSEHMLCFIGCNSIDGNACAYVVNIDEYFIERIATRQCGTLRLNIPMRARLLHIAVDPKFFRTDFKRAIQSSASELWKEQTQRAPNTPSSTSTRSADTRRTGRYDSNRDQRVFAN